MELKIEALSCGYRGSEPVISDVNLRLTSDDGLVCIIGPNGVGKSTLIKCIDNLIQPMEGRVLIDDIDVRSMSRRDLARKIGYVQAMSTTDSTSTVFETVSMGRYNHMKWRMEPQDILMVDRVLEVMGITELANHPINQLSAGQQQRVMIARGLVQDTDILILDEPTSNLDVRAQLFVASLLKNISKVSKKLIIMICHDINIASKVSDRILVLADPGMILAYGPPKEVITKENIQRTYGVDCDIVEHEGRPNVMIRSDSI